MTGQDVILGMLLNGPQSGYDIKQAFENLFSYFFDVSYGSIYPALNKLEKEGLIKKEVVIQKGKPNKNVFSITEQGKAKFWEYMSSPLERDVVKSDTLMRLYFSKYTDIEHVLVWLEEAREYSQQQLERLEKDYLLYKPNMTPTQELGIEYGIFTTKNNLQFLDKALQKMKALKSEERSK